jgi:hypothetical protein
MNIHQRTHRGPIKHPFSIRGIHVDTPVTHGVPKIIMPISAMDAIALVKIHGIGHVWQVITIARHKGRLQLYPYIKTAGDGWKCRHAGGNQETCHQVIPVVGVQHLLGQVHINPATAEISHLGGIRGAWARGVGGNRSEGGCECFCRRKGGSRGRS